MATQCINLLKLLNCTLKMVEFCGMQNYTITKPLKNSLLKKESEKEIKVLGSDYCIILKLFIYIKFHLLIIYNVLGSLWT